MARDVHSVTTGRNTADGTVGGREYEAIGECRRDSPVVDCWACVEGVNRHRLVGGEDMSCSTIPTDVVWCHVGDANIEPHRERATAVVRPDGVVAPRRDGVSTSPNSARPIVEGEAHREGGLDGPISRGATCGGWCDVVGREAEDEVDFVASVVVD